MHFDAKVGRSPIDSKVKRDDAPAVDDAPAFVHPVSNVVPGAMYPSLHNIYDQLKNCSQYITPDCLRALYSIPYVWSSVQRNPLGIVEYTPQAYVQSDLDLFFANYSQQQQQRTPILDSIDGGYIQTVNRSFNYNGESNLDLEYAMTLVNPIPVTVRMICECRPRTLLTGSLSPSCTKLVTQSRGRHSMTFLMRSMAPIARSRAVMTQIKMGSILTHSALQLKVPIKGPRTAEAMLLPK